MLLCRLTTEDLRVGDRPYDVDRLPQVDDVLNNDGITHVVKAIVSVTSTSFYVVIKRILGEDGRMTYMPDAPVFPDDWME